MSEPNHASAESAETPKGPSEFVTRLISALFMAVFAIAAVIAGSWAFALLVIVAGLIVNWEWARMVRGSGYDGLALMHGAALLVLVVLTETARYIEAGAVLAVAIAATILMGYRDKLRWSLAGVLYILLPAMALIWLRSDPEYGVWALLFVMAVAWTADSAAYVGGRLIGGPKLAPRISPKKTWAGFASGVLCSGLVGFAAGAFVPAGNALALCAVAIILAVAGSLGDLLESGVKRHFNAKDTSSLIPGHGGLLDRIDGLLIASLAAALIAFRDIAAPGQGLLQW
ncbi:Phosphatidate cytidylyltransferase [Methyloligella halotolerans]|uniref:Phosphatidate cytidylyltransferase n=1 Tax=Methyloligella halotolerans TaxID=1177755 RepID=A0A1E2S215_9HYPH|nr:phosphatidate cytidylyltransferase [Methyloligella halotolerans]ODA68491.1 Phosphatidate cytidylyltransferase [Methyloligella halotolerans]